MAAGLTTAVHLMFAFVVSLLAVPAAVPCSEACYREKSLAYQQCRSIPPAKRAERTRCFKKADQALERCLRSCR